MNITPFAQYDSIRAGFFQQVYQILQKACRFAESGLRYLSLARGSVASLAWISRLTVSGVSAVARACGQVS